MSSALLVPLVLGAVAVLQATINREVARTWGLAPTALLNMTVALVASAVFLGYCVWRGDSGGLLRVNFDASDVRGFWLMPGLFGCALVLGLPWAVARLGATSVFVSLVGAQIVTSAAWDWLAAAQGLSPQRLLGAVLAIVSVVLANWR